jgi:predicted ArsR family transcriptional regulator
MLLAVFNDLVKPQWRAVLEELKLSGGMAVSDLARKSGASYMAAKTHCEELTQAGYLIRTRLPRSEVGRPEIFYSLAAKADALFPQAGVDFTLDLLDALRSLYGDSAPEKLLFQYFQKLADQHAKQFDKLKSTRDKAVKLAALREKSGCACHCECAPDKSVSIMERHNPLQRVFERYPRAITMELRMLERLLDARLIRTEIPAGRDTIPHVVFEVEFLNAAGRI